MEIAIIGSRDEATTTELLRPIYQRYLPNRVIAGTDVPGKDELSPLLAGRERVDGQTTAYVCEHYVCKLPVTTPEALIEQLMA
jgi:uncharacterized protein YyaL (SSP411 family)